MPRDARGGAEDEEVALITHEEMMMDDENKVDRGREGHHVVVHSCGAERQRGACANM
jgi:hypothetical protein